MTTFAIIEDGQTHQIEATMAGGTIRLAPAGVRAALGWEQKPEGLCRGEVCVPTSRHTTLVDADGIDLEAFASLLGLPLALDAEERAACLGRSSLEHAGVLKSGEAPDFTLPDLDGTLHTLSAHRGKKVLLVAYASW
jgi:hypothetical protein